ncbi:MAG: hypothetical protein EOO61_14660 [Hymenobacter sp.]|nr:MAG: hypothetical protein EOO61_14660 [Hymenobacter sp.]
MSRTCQICGKSLEGKRADAKTCGTSCRNVLSIERKKECGLVNSQPAQVKSKELLEDKLIYIENYIQDCRALMVGKSERLSCGVMLRALFEIEEAARSIIPDLDMTKSSKQRAEERYILLRKAGWQ